MATEAPKRWVSRKQLAQAVLLSNAGEFTEFAFAKNLPEEDLGLNTLKVGGLDVQLPVSLQNIESLKHIINNASETTGINNICAIPQDLNLSNLVIHNLGLHSGLMRVQEYPSQLTLYDGNGEHKHCWSTISDSKLVAGKVILQIPVERDHKGGALKVTYSERSKILENDQSSDQCFYISAFYNFCNDVMEPLKKGFKVTLVFNLVWTRDNEMNVKDIPAFLTTLKKTNAALAAWHNPNSLEVQMDLQEEDNSDDKCDTEDDHDGNSSTEDDSDENSSTEDEFENICLSNETLSDDVLFFVLQENYCESDLKFNGLRGKDKNLAHVLQSCDFLDVHLACVTLKSFNIEYGGMSRCATESVSLEITRWLDANNVIKNLNMELNWDKQRVGPIRNLLNRSGPHTEKRTPLTTEEEKDMEDTNYMPLLLCFMPESKIPKPVKRTECFFRGILVIWPKNQSSLLHLHYGMNSILEEIENSLTSFALVEETREEDMRKLRSVRKICAFSVSNSS